MGGASSLTKTLISQSALCTFASAFTLVTLALCVKCRRTLKGTLIAIKVTLVLNLPNEYAAIVCTISSWQCDLVVVVLVLLVCRYIAFPPVCMHSAGLGLLASLMECPVKCTLTTLPT